jgi:gliding motility-associated-like protein
MDSFVDVICEGDVYTLNSMNYSSQGIHYDTIIGGATSGCDSILILDLTVIDRVETAAQAAICDGDTYDWNNMVLSVAGTYTDTLTSLLTGCDSVLVLDLAINPLPTVEAGASQELSCSMLTVILDGSGSGAPVWTGPGVVNPNVYQTEVATPGLYYLNVTSAECVAVDSVMVTVDPDFPVGNAGPDQFMTCEDSVITLQGSANDPGLLFTWTGPGIMAGDEHLERPVVLIPGTYILVVEDTVDMCVSPPDTVLVTDIRVDLLANINASNHIDCNNSSVLLTAGGSSTGPRIVFIWLNPIDQISLNVSSINATIPGTYILFAIDTLSMCQAVDSHVVLDLIAFPPADAGQDTVLDCNVGFLSLIANSGLQDPDLSYQWSGPAGGIITNPNTQSITIVLPGTYMVTVTDASNGCTSTDAVLVIDSRDQPVAEAGPMQFLNCGDDTAVLDGSLSSSGAEYQYIWNGPGVQNIADIIIEVDLPGWYFLRVHNMETGCDGMDSTLVQMADFLAGAEIEALDPLCFEDNSGQISIMQTLGGVPPFEYSLDGILFQSSPIFGNLVAGTYSLVIRDAVDCEWDTTIVIQDGPLLTLDIGPDLELEFGESTNLFAIVLPPGIMDSIVWSPLAALSCNYCLDPTLTAIYTNNFTVTATAYAGNCIAIDQLLVSVDSDFEIFVPNVFSPNNDNINDFVSAFGGKAVKRIVEFEIFDRWGELIFHKGDFPLNIPTLGWDGTFKNKLMNPGVFVYKLQVELINGELRYQTGDITLVR